MQPLSLKYLLITDTKEIIIACVCGWVFGKTREKNLLNLSDTLSNHKMGAEIMVAAFEEKALYKNHFIGKRPTDRPF